MNHKPHDYQTINLFLNAAAGVIEHVGWTNGSNHNQMLRHGQSWIALQNLDLAAALSGVLLGLMLVSAYAVKQAWAYVNARRQQPSASGPKVLKKQQ